MRFGDLPSTRRPMRVVDMPPSAFAAGVDAAMKPSQVGLVTISQEAIQRARGAAATEAWVLHAHVDDLEHREQAFRELYACHLLATAVTDPSEANRPPDAWAAAPSDAMRAALTDQGMRWLIAQLEELHINSSPLGEEADEMDIECLTAVMTMALPVAPAHVASSVRRLLRHCLNLVAAYIPEGDGDRS